MTGYRTPRGLTLIEIVVLIVIVLVLAAFLVSGANSSLPRGSARRVSCLNNLKQLVMSCQLYADIPANNGFFPNDGSSACGSMNLLYDKYVQEYRLWKCPGNPTSPVKLETITPSSKGRNLTNQMTNYGYDRRHKPADKLAIVVSDMGPTADPDQNSKNHGMTDGHGSGQNVVDCSGAGRWIDTTKRDNTKQSDDIFTDDSTNAMLGVSGDSWIRND